MKRMRHVLLVSLLSVLSATLFGQGATTSSLRGTVTDPSGEPLIGATVAATHVNTGALYGTITDFDGSYNIPNMQIGQYNVRVSYTGFGDKEVQGLVLRLGQPQRRDFNLEESAIELVGVQVVAQRGGSGQNAGAATQIPQEQIEVLPTLNRDLTDFTRLTPQASTAQGGGRISFAGVNNRFNSIYVDGAVSNDVFGLAGNGANGGQTGIQPISVDWVEDIQVMLSPYDVTVGGFAGGGINMVTKSGTNEFTGSAYYFTRNEELAGKTNQEVADRDGQEREKLDEFTERLYGVTLGGPIVKNKLFFFAGAELRDDEIPNPFSLNTYRGDATQADLDRLSSFLQSEYGYDPGTVGNVTQTLEGTSLFGKLNWNINEKHKLVLRHSYVKAENIEPFSSRGSSINFSNVGIFFPSETNTTTLQLNSLFSNRSSNSLILAYTSVNDDRDPLGSQPFPELDIFDGNGTINIGSEPFSTANALEQKQFTLTNNFKLFRGDHTWTFGTHNEFYDIRNVFIPWNYGSYDYASIDAFINGEAPIGFIRSYSLPNDVVGDATTTAAEFNAMQLGFYVQDEWSATNRLTITAGIRADIPVITTDPNHHPSLEQTLETISGQYEVASRVNVGEAPSGQLMLSPKLGFNYDFNRDGSSVIRGGLGIFTSRIPFVWPGAMFNNNGIGQGQRFAPPQQFVGDVNNQPVDENFSIPSGQVDLFVNDFKYPQVFRTSLAWDKDFGDGLVGTFEGIYTKFLNNVVYTNVNNDQTGASALGGDAGGERIRYTRSDIDDRYSAIYVADNTSEGWTYSLTAALQKRFAFGLNASLAYNYNDAESVNEGTSSQNSSQWRGQIHVRDRNTPVLGRSDFAVGHRLIGTLSFTQKWNGTENFATRFALVYEGQSGEAFSYVVGRGSANGRNLANETGSTSRERTLVYIPRSIDEINLVETNGLSPQEQWALLDNFIENDDYLKENRGKYAEKNGARAPWNNRWDLSIRQNLGATIGQKSHRLQLSVDIINFANLLNSSWGTQFSSPGENVYGLYTLEGVEDGVAQYSFTETDFGDDPITGIYNLSNLASRWTMRLGLRYQF